MATPSINATDPYEVHNFKRRGVGLVVRVIQYKLDNRGPKDTSYTLITTILDPAALGNRDLSR